MTERTPQQQLDAFLAKYTPEIESLAKAILSEMRKRYPSAQELVYDNYNALAIGFGPTERASDAIFSIAVYPRWISLFFLQAKGLPDPANLLCGKGSVARHIVLPGAATLAQPAVEALMQEAVRRARIPFGHGGKPRLTIKSISAKQRPRRPASSSGKPAVKPTSRRRTA